MTHDGKQYLYAAVIVMLCITYFYFLLVLCVPIFFCTAYYAWKQQVELCEQLATGKPNDTARSAYESSEPMKLLAQTPLVNNLEVFRPQRLKQSAVPRIDRPRAFTQVKGKNQDQ